MHISHTCNLYHNIKALVISIEGEILLLNLPSVLGFTQRKLVRCCEIAGNLDGRYNIKYFHEQQECLSLLESIAKVPDRQVAKIGKSSIF